MDRNLETQCCIAGGGPAGMMLGYLLARAGVKTVVLEKHGDFLRDFRGDTIHPSTLELMHELGLLEEFLRLPHQQITELTGMFGKRRIKIADFSRTGAICKFIALMPQWDFLNFIAAKAKAFPQFTLMMRAEAQELTWQGDRVTGLRAATSDGQVAITAPLTIAADGRHSILRTQARLPLKDIGAPIDVLWFRVRREPSDRDETFAFVDRGKFLVTLNRGDYWQCAYVIAKGAADAVKAKGLEAFRADVAKISGSLAPHIHELASWDDVKLLTVSIDRLERWHCPGFLAIGDAAHAMSPVGGVGINLAIQDAVAAANQLADKLRAGIASESDAAAVQRRRMFPTRVTQGIQVQAQTYVLQPVISGQNATLTPPLALRVLTHSPWLRGLAARVVGIGVRPEHIKTADHSGSPN